MVSTLWHLLQRYINAAAVMIWYRLDSPRSIGGSEARDIFESVCPTAKTLSTVGVDIGNKLFIHVKKKLS